MRFGPLGIACLVVACGSATTSHPSTITESPPVEDIDSPVERGRPEASPISSFVDRTGAIELSDLIVEDPSLHALLPPAQSVHLHMGPCEANWMGPTPGSCRCYEVEGERDVDIDALRTRGETVYAAQDVAEEDLERTVRQGAESFVYYFCFRVEDHGAANEVRAWAERFEPFAQRARIFEQTHARVVSASFRWRADGSLTLRASADAEVTASEVAVFAERNGFRSIRLDEHAGTVRAASLFFSERTRRIRIEFLYPNEGLAQHSASPLL